ncbi:hypothetical protein ACWXVL_00115 [Mycoplasma sp. 128]|uniref:hypothetical protein n=1 Tax=Mycoplasma sp. 3341 TaxID=3447506 RepID=UPI003F65A019
MNKKRRFCLQLIGVLIILNLFLLPVLLPIAHHLDSVNWVKKYFLSVGPNLGLIIILYSSCVLFLLKHGNTWYHSMFFFASVKKIEITFKKQIYLQKFSGLIICLAACFLTIFLNVRNDWYWYINLGFTLAFLSDLVVVNIVSRKEKLIF